MGLPILYSSNILMFLNFHVIKIRKFKYLIVSMFSRKMYPKTTIRTIEINFKKKQAFYCQLVFSLKIKHIKIMSMYGYKKNVCYVP